MMLVNGQGGMGKSSFAAKYWERYECQYQFLMSVFAANGITDALLRLAMPLNLEFEPTMPNNERLKILIQHIQRLDKPCLLFLDNVDQADELRSLYPLLYRCKNFHILITSRLFEFPYLAKNSINALPLEVALRVFRHHYPQFEEQEILLFEQVYQEVAGNTLVLELFAKNLNYFNKIRKNYSLNTLIEDIKIGLTKLTKQEKIDVMYKTTDFGSMGFGLVFDTPKNIILAMYDLTELSEAEKTILSVFSILPVENIEYEVLEKILIEKQEDEELIEMLQFFFSEQLNNDVESLEMYLTQNPNLTKEEIDTAIKLAQNIYIKNEELEQIFISLTQKGWIEQTETAFKVSPVVQEVVRHKNQERLFNDCGTTIKILSNQLNQHNNPNYYQENYKSVIIYSHYAESIFSKLEYNYHKQDKKDKVFTLALNLLAELIAKYYELKGDLSKTLLFFEKNHTILNNLPQIIDQKEQNNYWFVLAGSFENLGNILKTLINCTFLCS